MDNPKSSIDAGTAVSAQAAAARALPSWVYRDPEFLELEREHIFMRTWQLVCHVNDLPLAGDYHTFQLLGETAFVVRGEDGRLRAFYNVCRHRAARLLDGSRGQCGRRIACPYHAWTYALDGRLVGIPFRTEYEGLNPGNHGLVPLECEVFLGFVFLRFEPGGPTLSESFAPAVDEMRLYRLEDLQPLGSIASRGCCSNWKNSSDNYIDALHVRVAHKGLDSLVGTSYGMAPMGPVHRLSGEIEQRPQAGWSVRNYCKVLPQADHLPAEYRRRWLYFLAWPNLTFNLYPDLVEFMQFLPVSPTETLIRDGSYALPDTRRAMDLARRLNMRINRRVGREDRDLIERVQAGMMSRSYSAGPLGHNETCLRAFAECMRELLPVARRSSPPPRGTVAQCNREMATAAANP